MAVVYSITEFKQLYFRFFTNFSPYSKWDTITNYTTNTIVYYENNMLVYKALQNNTNKQPDINTADWELQPNINIANYITETDLQIAYNFALHFLSGVLTKDYDKKQGFYLLMAHFLQLNVENISQQGNQGFDGLLNSRTVGSVSEGYTPNQAYLDLSYSTLRLTRFGQQYIALCNLKNTNTIFTIKSNFI